MLRLTKAWTDRDRVYGKAAGYGYSFWLSGVEPSGDAWCLIAYVGGKGIGFTEAIIRKVLNEDAIARELATADDENNPDSWAVIEPSEAMAVISTEMDRARDAVWSHEYADHFALVSSEYELFRRAITEADPVRPYARFPQTT